MGNKIINTVDGLTKLKEEWIKAIDENIANAKLNESINKLDTVPFSTLVHIFEQVSDKLYDSKKGKTLIKRYVKLMKENKDMNSLYLISEIIREPKNITDCNIFMTRLDNINENIDKKRLSKGLSELKQIIKECVIEANIISNDLDVMCQYNKNLFESIDYVISSKTTASNINEQTNKRACIMEHLSKCNQIIKESENKQVQSLDINTINNTLNEMPDWCNNLCKNVLLHNLSGNDKSDLFEEYKKRCLDIIEESMDESEIGEKSQLFTIKEQLKNKTYNSLTIDDDLVKLAELQYTLEND